MIGLTIWMLLRRIIRVYFSINESSYFCGIFAHIKWLLECTLSTHTFFSTCTTPLRQTFWNSNRKKNKGPTMVFFRLQIYSIHWNKLLIITANWNEFCKYCFDPLHISITKIIFGIVFTYPNNNYIWICVVVLFRAWTDIICCTIVKCHLRYTIFFFFLNSVLLFQLAKVRAQKKHLLKLYNFYICMIVVDTFQYLKIKEVSERDQCN